MYCILLLLHSFSLHFRDFDLTFFWPHLGIFYDFENILGFSILNFQCMPHNSPIRGDDYGGYANLNRLCLDLTPKTGNDRFGSKNKLKPIPLNWCSSGETTPAYRLFGIY